jgi:hypothetical protein
VYEGEDDLREDKGIITRYALLKAERMATQRKAVEAKAAQVLRSLDKVKLKQLSLVQDEIVKVGIENLETEEGRASFLANMRHHNLIIDNATISDLIQKEGHFENEETKRKEVVGVASTQRFANLVNIVSPAQPAFWPSPELSPALDLEYELVSQSEDLHHCLLSLLTSEKGGKLIEVNKVYVPKDRELAGILGRDKREELLSSVTNLRNEKKKELRQESPSEKRTDLFLRMRIHQRTQN